jgi:hypothetical protein
MNQMPYFSPFADEWRECLREQYMEVIRNDDQVTLKTLVGVLYEVGFTEDELKELYLRATMHVDDLRDGFVPDMEIIAPPAAEQPAAPPPEPEASVEPESSDEEHAPDGPKRHDGPPPAVQLSLF